jgi:BRI1 kinase inhibitor 1
MSAGAPVGRVGSDRSYYSRASRHPIPTTRYAGSKENRDRDKNRTPHFFSGIGGSWRKESRKGDTTNGKKPAEEKKKDKANRALDLGQWVKKYMAAMVEQLPSTAGMRSGNITGAGRTRSQDAARAPRGR